MIDIGIYYILPAIGSHLFSPGSSSELLSESASEPASIRGLGLVEQEPSTSLGSLPLSSSGGPVTVTLGAKLSSSEVLAELSSGAVKGSFGL